MFYCLAIWILELEINDEISYVANNDSKWLKKEDVVLVNWKEMKLASHKNLNNYWKTAKMATLINSFIQTRIQYC